MGCNCGGSAKRKVPQTLRRDNRDREQARRVTTEKPPKPREGGPGSKAYVWSGPRARRKA